MIKYLGSKRRLVPVIARLAMASGASSALDLFTGTTRVAQALKHLGMRVTAVDTARYAEVFARCYIESDADDIDTGRLAAIVSELNRLPGEDGYFTETFCVRSRFFQPANGARIDAVRDAIGTRFASSPLEPILLTSLLEAADRVDSTVGVQMAYVKQWAPRSYRPLELRPPELLSGSGRAVRGDAEQLAPTLGSFDFAYLDPPYNQHRYFTNYHIWETLVAWDAPEHYGVACKRLDARDPSTKSAFNSKKSMPTALRRTIRSVDCELLVLSYNDESWLDLEALHEMCSHHSEVVTLEFDSARYVGARIGIHDPSGRKVGTVSHLRNREYLVVAGSPAGVRRALAGVDASSAVASRDGAIPRHAAQHADRQPVTASPALAGGPVGEVV
ncbi:MAG: DNA adenine methylase [Actinomycetota bacterium]|jgi:adenine-specific DNA-methyltransferase|nr:DNA adenine methylase [Actinomycetota bacterium]